MNQFDIEAFSIGQRFGDYEIVDMVKVSGDTHRHYLMKCTKCNRTTIKTRRAILKKERYEHGQFCSQITKAPDKFRVTFMAMKTRATNPNIKCAEQYKDITTHDYIHFVDFYDDMYESWCEHVERHGIKNTTLDRIDPKGHYNRGNIRWATYQVQSENQTRITPLYIIRPKLQQEFWFKTYAEADRYFGFNRGRLRKYAIDKNGVYLEALDMIVYRRHL